MNTSVAFDTLAYANKLKQGGFSDDQAEVLAEVQADSVRDLIDEKLATKHDIALVKQDIKELESSTKKEIEFVKQDIKELEMNLTRDIKELESSTKKEIELVRKEIELLKRDLTVRLGLMLIGTVALVTGLMEFFHYLHGSLFLA